MRRKTWTGLCRKTQTFPGFDGAQLAERYLNALFAIPAYEGTREQGELHNSFENRPELIHWWFSF